MAGRVRVHAGGAQKEQVGGRGPRWGHLKKKGPLKGEEKKEHTFQLKASSDLQEIILEIF